MLLLGLIGLLVVGPRELPAMVRVVGRYFGRLQHMARDFRRQMEEIADEADPTTELKEWTKNPDLLGIELDADMDAPDLRPPHDDKKQDDG